MHGSTRVVSTIGADVCAACCMCSAFVWGVCLLLPSGWHVCHIFHALRLNSGLYQVEVTKGGAASVISGAASLFGKGDKISKILETFVGTWSLQEMRDKLCGMDGVMNLIGGDLLDTDFCENFIWLQNASIMFLFMGLFVVIFFVAAAACVYYLFHGQATRNGLTFSKMFLTIAPAWACMSLFVYFVGGYFLGDEGEDGVPIGMCFFVCLFTSLLSFAPMIGFSTFVASNAERLVTLRSDVKEATEFQSQYNQQFVPQQQPAVQMTVYAQGPVMMPGPNMPPLPGPGGAPPPYPQQSYPQQNYSY